MHFNRTFQWGLTFSTNIPSTIKMGYRPTTRFVGWVTHFWPNCLLSNHRLRRSPRLRNRNQNPTKSFRRHLSLRTMTAQSGGGVGVKRVFIGAGCNRIVNNVSWGASGLVSFGAHNAVAIFCPKVPLHSLLITYLILFPVTLCLKVCIFVLFGFVQSAQILTTLPGHKAVVNCTHWLPSTKFQFKGKLFFNLPWTWSLKFHVFTTVKLYLD